MTKPPPLPDATRASLPLEVQAYLAAVEAYLAALEKLLADEADAGAGGGAAAGAVPATDVTP